MGDMQAVSKTKRTNRYSPSLTSRKRGKGHPKTTLYHLCIPPPPKKGGNPKIPKHALLFFTIRVVPEIGSSLWEINYIFIHFLPLSHTKMVCEPSLIIKSSLKISN